MQVLQRKQEIIGARKELREKGASRLEPAIVVALKRVGELLGIDPSPSIGDQIKSWDVLLTLRFIERHLKKGDAILDIGCYASEVIITLFDLGFIDLSGIDLNPKLRRMPHADCIRYVSGNFMASPFENESFNAVTSISVIEHGFNGPMLMKEMARILRPGGYFIASFDYWPEKVLTEGTRFFNLDWLIFSRDDVANLVDEAARHGLFPAGNMNFEAQEKPVGFGGFSYTFGWLVLEKTLRK